MKDILRNDKIKNISLAISSGVITALLFPLFNLEFLAWIALVPLLYAVYKSKGFKESFLYGFIAGIVSYIIILYWIVYTVSKFGGLPYYIAVFALLLLASYLALYAALFAGFSKIILNRYKKLSFILIPSSWVKSQISKQEKCENRYIVRKTAEFAYGINYPVKYNYV